MPAMQPAGSYIDRVLSEFQAAQDQANQANIGRYGDILGRYNTLANQQSRAISNVPQQYQDIASAFGQRTSDLAGRLQGFGDVQRARLEQDRDNRRQSVEASAVNRGLSNSTIRENMLVGVEDQYQQARNELEDATNRQQMDYLSALTGQELSARSMVPQAQMGVAQQQFAMGERPLQFMERRTDTGPSLADVAHYSTTAGTGSAGIPN